MRRCEVPVRTNNGRAVLCNQPTVFHRETVIEVGRKPFDVRVRVQWNACSQHANEVAYNHQELTTPRLHTRAPGVKA